MARGAGRVSKTAPIMTPTSATPSAIETMTSARKAYSGRRPLTTMKMTKRAAAVATAAARVRLTDQ